LISGNSLVVRRATSDDLVTVKRLADAHRHELGFVLLPSLRERIDRDEMLVAEMAGDVAGFVDYRRRRDGQMTLYHIAVASTIQRRGAGRSLLAALEEIARTADCAHILLKCPVDLAANEFYRRCGFQLDETLDGRKRALNVWRLLL